MFLLLKCKDTEKLARRNEENQKKVRPLRETYADGPSRLFCRVDPIDEGHQCDGCYGQQDEDQFLDNRLPLHAVEVITLVSFRIIHVVMVVVVVMLLPSSRLRLLGCCVLC